MKRLVMCLAVAGFVLCAWSAPAHALLLTDLIDFGAPGLGPGDAGSIGVLDDAPPAWVHDIRDTVGGSAFRLHSAALSVSYRGTDGNEHWALAGDGLPLGALAATGNPILTTTFALSAEALAALEADGLFSVVPLESTPSRDGVRLYQASLSADYTLLPEPGTWLLMSLGGWIWSRRRRAGC